MMSGSLFIDDPKTIDFAWESLARVGYSKDEDSLLRALEDNKSKNIVYCATLGLQVIGTQKSIPRLKQLALYPHRDTRAMHVMGVAKIGGGEQTPYLTKLLQDKKFTEKGYVLAAIWEVGDARGVEAVRQHAKYLLRQKEPRLDDLWYASEYLARYDQNYSASQMHADIDSLLAEKPSPLARFRSLLGRMFGK